MEPSTTLARIQVDADLPDITPAQSLTGWRRELCIELLGDGGARIFVRAVERSSFKAADLQRGVLFHRLDSRFTDLTGCMQSQHAELVHLAETARRLQPERANLFVALEYDRTSWERVQHAVDRWARR